MRLSEIFQAMGAGIEALEYNDSERKMVILRNIIAIRDEYERLLYWLDQLEQSLKEV
jgi:hypothetical protein